MKKTILVPTDFSIESLHVVKSLLSRAHEEELFNIILLSGVHLSDSITELLFFSRTSLIQSMSNRHFDEACMVIKNKFSSQINSMCKDIFTGATQSAFNNYVEANKIDKAYISTNYKLQMPSKKSFDILPYIKKSALLIDQVDWKVETRVTERGKLSAIFANSISSN
ncbi:hypothetical protein [Catalinimonas niigatensis]|uniref:hypothetical protein n=1 Tax=Catalinimonas niigatensis TaxID=1397264 RepID=UPI002666A543|nr:hypothetical protein [Catalinimonas niigatensis]WPP50519.1 hypothetical protein PZB72_28040 [Catalinimonas niigatensis]